MHFSHERHKYGISLLLSLSLVLGLNTLGAIAVSGSELGRAADFLGSIEVNIHLNYGDTSYADVKGVITDLGYLELPTFGVTSRKLIIPWEGPGSSFTLLWRFSTDPLQDVAALDAYVQAHPGVVSVNRGADEINNWPVMHNGQSGDEGGVAYQTALFQAVKADPVLTNIPVYNLTDWPILVAPADFGNVHIYSDTGGNQPRTLFQELVDRAQQVTPGKEIVVTETGYSSAPAASGSVAGVDEATQAKLILNTLFDAANLGVKQTFIYELLDEHPDPGNTSIEQHFGLFHSNGTAKPAAVAIHNLTTILRDGATYIFPTAALNYSILGLPPTAHSLLLQKASGAYHIAVWNEPDIWNEATLRPIPTAAQSVTIDLHTIHHTVNIFDPLKGTAPVQMLTDVSTVSIGVSDHPLIVEIEP